MVLDVSFIVSPQALPRGGVEQEGKGLERDGDADVQVSVGHVVVEGAGALLPTERAPEQAGGVDAGPEDERRGDEACRGKGQLLFGLWWLVRRRQSSPCVSEGVFLRDPRVRGPHSVGLQHSGGRTPSGG